MEEHATCDVAILGGGLAGLSLALHCRQVSPKAQITILEKASHPVPEAAFKVGESTVEVAANYFANVLGLKQHILDAQLPKLGLRFFFPAGENRAIEERFELGSMRFAVAPSYQLDRGRFENFLATECQSAGMQFVDRAKVGKLQLNGRSGHMISFERDGESHTVKSKWIADASGRAGILKRQLGLERSSPHNANAVWFRVKAGIQIDEWSDAPEWGSAFPGEGPRWYSTNHLMGEGYWVWLIPLASGSTSIGIVADAELHPLSSYNSLPKALDWLDRHEPQCAEHVRAHRDKIQDFLAVKHYAMECDQVFSRQRWGITGEAGFFLDPFYSPGSDFITFANTFLSDLIRRDLSGGGFRYRAFLYDRIFKKFFHGTAAVYQGQYPLFGNHQVMPVKIMWDYLVYWSLTAFICLHDRVCNQFMYPRHMMKLGRLGQLNHFMQDFFRQWHAAAPSEEVHGSVDVSGIPLIRDTNASLVDELDRKAFDRRFAQNVAQVETLFWEILEHSQLDVRVPFKRRHYRDVREGGFREIFEATRSSSTSVGGSGAPQRQTQVV